MSSDKRRRARVQGGWANHDSKPRSDWNKPKPPQAPAWTGKNADSTAVKKFVYQEADDIRVKPKEKTIDKPGVYDLSVSEKGVSRVRLFYNFFGPKESQSLYQQLFQEIPWRQRSDVKNGESYLQPRLTAWYGDHPYSYSGVSHEADPEMTPALRVVKARLEENTGLQFNSVLANLYWDGHDSVAWHSDDEPSLKDNPTIASMTFGEMRTFQLRQKPAPGEDPTDYTYSEHVNIPLTSGCLLIMEGASQVDWQHRIPREYHDRGPRINLTFRIIYPESRFASLC